MSDSTPARYADSPFDVARRTDGDGEFWSARELMPLLGYDTWRRLEDAIDRAKMTCRNSGHTVTSNFLQVSQLVGAGNLGEQSRVDYRLTRYGAYLVAMNGDPRKPEIAAAQTYFAVKTREAEVARPHSQIDVLRAALDQIEAAQLTADRAERTALESRAVADDVSHRVAALEGNHGWYSALAYAKRMGWPTDAAALNTLGRRAGQIGRAANLSAVKVPHPTYGEVNAWPEWAWDQAYQDGADT